MKIKLSKSWPNESQRGKVVDKVDDATADLWVNAGYATRAPADANPDVVIQSEVLPDISTDPGYRAARDNWIKARGELAECRRDKAEAGPAKKMSLEGQEAALVKKVAAADRAMKDAKFVAGKKATDWVREEHRGIVRQLAEHFVAIAELHRREELLFDRLENANVPFLVHGLRPMYLLKDQLGSLHDCTSTVSNFITECLDYGFLSGTEPFLNHSAAVQLKLRSE